MAASSATISNLALAHLGVQGTVIVTLATDTTTAGKSCRAFYETARRETLMAHPWNIATVQGALTYVGTTADEDGAEFAYRHRLPESCLVVRRVLYGSNRNVPAGHRIPFKLFPDTDSTTYAAGTTYALGDYAESSSLWYRALRETIGDTPASSASDWVAIASLTPTGCPPMYLLCDLPEDTLIEYTREVTDTRLYTPDLDNAIAARLAFYIAPSVAVGQTTKQIEMYRLWSVLISQASANDRNQEQRDEAPMSSFEAARTW